MHENMWHAMVLRLDGLASFAVQPSRSSCRPSARQALKDLLRGRSAYGGEAADQVLAPFRHNLVSLPASSDSSPAVIDLVGDRCRQLLEGDGERILRAEAEVEQLLSEGVGSYSHPLLVGSTGRYARFVRSPRLRRLRTNRA